VPEECAWYFEPGRADDASRAIAAFAAAPPAERVARAERAQAALASLTWPAEAARLRELYRELLAAQPR
jgi:glycosyltransferase involved in cell wall biosynthesis